MTLSFSMSEIVALCVESIIYGGYLALFVINIRAIMKRYEEFKSTNIAMNITTILLFVLITFHICIDAVRVMVSFQQDTVPEADLYYEDYHLTLGVLKTAVYVAITVLSDAFILSRCYIVWNGNKYIMALPTILVLGDVGMGIAAVIGYATLDASETFYVKKETVITLFFFAATMIANGLCTGLIAFKIWVTQRSTAKHVHVIDTRKNSKLSRIIAIVLESGAIYTTSLCLVVATYAAHSTAAFNVFLDMTSPLIGVVFSLIFVRSYQSNNSPKSPSFTHISGVEFAPSLPTTRMGVTSPRPIYSRDSMFTLPQSLSHITIERTTQVTSDEEDARRSLGSVKEGVEIA